jgi:hypothetical protein
MQRITINTPDGLGEAIKTDRDTPWEVNLPTRGFRFYGSLPQVRAEIRKRLKQDYSKAERAQIEIAKP